MDERATSSDDGWAAMADTCGEPPGGQQELAALYSRVAPIYAEHGPPFFEHAGRRLVELAQVRPGDVVLDVATGRGAVLIPAARCAGPTGQVVGIDIAPGMVDHTRRSIEQQGLTDASVELMDAAELGLESGAFTHELCSFAVFFFPDVGGVLGELRRVLRPGGVLGFAFSRDTDPRWVWYEDLLRSYGALDDPSPASSQRSIRHPGVLVALLEEAGFAGVVEREETEELRYATPEVWWASLWTHGSRRPLERLRPDVVHFDFSPANVPLVGQRVTGVVDWQGVRAGDRLFDLATLLFYTYQVATCVDGCGQPR